MQLGTESRNKTIAAVVLMALGLILMGYVLFSGPSATAPQTASAPVPASMASARLPAQRAATAAKASREVSLDPTLRLDWLKASEETKYAGAGRNIFRAEAEAQIQKPLGNGTTDKQAASQAAGPVVPQLPPINLKFFGFASKPGEPKKVFLSQGEDVFIASEGEIVNRRYKILRIGPASVEIEDVLNNNRQSIPLTQG